MAISPTRRRVAADDTSMDGGIAICVDQSELSRKVIPYALAIVGAWDVPATLLHVLEVARANNGRPDPIEWELRRREARHSLERTAASAGSLGDRIETELVEGQAAEQICRWAR